MGGFARWVGGWEVGISLVELKSNKFSMLWSNDFGSCTGLEHAKNLFHILEDCYFLFKILKNCPAEYR